MSRRPWPVRLCKAFYVFRFWRKRGVRLRTALKLAREEL